VQELERLRTNHQSRSVGLAWSDRVYDCVLWAERKLSKQQYWSDETDLSFKVLTLGHGLSAIGKPASCGRLATHWVACFLALLARLEID